MKIMKRDRSDLDGKFLKQSAMAVKRVIKLSCLRGLAPMMSFMSPYFASINESASRFQWEGEAQRDMRWKKYQPETGSESKAGIALLSKQSSLISMT
jgi:hypothetical protein